MSRIGSSPFEGCTHTISIPNISDSAVLGTYCYILYFAFSPVAETRNSAFRSTHELEKATHRILLEQCLLSKAQYVVKWKSGIRSEINGCFSMSLAIEHENEAKKYRTFPFTIAAPKSTDMS